MLKQSLVALAVALSLGVAAEAKDAKRPASTASSPSAAASVASAASSVATKVEKAASAAVTKTEEAVKKGTHKTKEAVTPASSAASTKAQHKAASADEAAGATGKCKDGTYTHAKQRKGACSRHGGVEEWLQK